ncbi:MAG: response regulator [Gemmatimonadetes bacterium]|nr:response regulator [Gemmatimonadota bacterium]
MDERTKEQIFEPFFTTKPPGVGTGLGMAMIYGLMKQQGGFVELESAADEGTTVRLYLPLARAAAPGEGVSEVATEELPRGCETVLLVEDEPRIRVTGKRILETFGYTVLLAADGREAFDLIEASESRVDLVVSDVVMPNMNGYELRDALREIGSGAKFLFTSGYAAAEAHEHADLEFDAPLLPKPWTLTELVQGVRAVLDTGGGA